MAYYRVYSVVGWSLALLVLFGADISHAQSAQCASSVTSCLLPAKDMGTPTTSAEFQTVCTLFSELMTCLYNLDSDCRNNENIRKIIKPLEFFYSFCKTLTADGRCTEAIDCFSQWLQPSSANASCNEVLTILSCLQNKTETSDRCTIDESKITFAVVKNLTADMCTVEKPCLAAENCIKLPGVPDVSVLENMNDLEAVDKLKPIRFSMTDPGFYCRLLESTTGCYATHQTECNFSDQHVQDMQSRHDNLTQICPPEPSSKGGRLVPETSALVSLLLLLPLLAAFF